MNKLNIEIIEIEKPDETNFILGQSHFIKTVEDIHEALVASVPGIKFGLAFCEASGPRLIRWSGNDETMINLAKKNLAKIAAGHSFIIFLGKGFYPVNVLKTLQAVSEVVTIYCATANPAEIIVAQTALGRAVLGVVDGGLPNGTESLDDVKERKNFLREIGYKL